MHVIPLSVEILVFPDSLSCLIKGLVINTGGGGRWATNTHIEHFLEQDLYFPRSQDLYFQDAPTFI
jgi:hypothetical protein